MFRKDCFAYKEKDGLIFCTALIEMSCGKCKFYHTKEYYRQHVLPLRHKEKSGGV